MAVKVSKLWNDNTFLRFSNNSKLLYIYLITNPCIMSVGVISLNIDLAVLQLGLSIRSIREATIELISNSYIEVKKFNNVVYFIVPKHFNTVPKSDTTVMKINKELDTLPKGLVKFLDHIGINTNRKVVTFKEPSPEEVMDYSLSQGYKVDADTFISFYRNKAKAYGKEGLWVDGRGKQVKDWRAKLKVVWFKDEHKLKTVDGAPKGFEYFYIDFEGKQVFPESWKNGLPHSRNIAVDRQLKNEYNEKRVDSSKDI